MSKFWKFYFYLAIILIIIEFSLRVVVSYFIAGEPYFSPKNQLDLTVKVICLIGLYGFVFKRKIISQVFWIIIFIAIIPYDVWCIYSEIMLEEMLNKNCLSTSSVLDFLGEFTFFFLLSLPFYIALFLYGFKSKDIWSKKLI